LRQISDFWGKSGVRRGFKAKPSHHYNDEFIIPLAQSKTLRAWLAEKISIMFGSNLELKVEKEGETTFAKGRTVEEIERLFEIAQKNKPAESKDEKKKKK
jgi:hypothetical protein